MKRFFGKRTKFIYIELSLFFIFCYFLLFGEIVTFERTGDNFFHLNLNGTEIGTVSDPDEANDLLTQARKSIAMESDDLVFVDAELTYTGEEVLWGKVDDENTVYQNMVDVLEASVMDAPHKAYTLKIHDYTVNLESLGEVRTLLDSAVSRYDVNDEFEVIFSQNNDREFNLLEASVVRKEESALSDDEGASSVFADAGFEETVREAMENAEPETEPDFEDYELGVLEIYFSDDVEIVETYLPDTMLDGVDEAVANVTAQEEAVSVYEVASGDTLSQIAIDLNVPVETLVELNESLDDENSTIHIGDELIYMIPETFLSVTVVEESYIEESYDADVVYVDNDSWYTNHSEVLQQPSAGYHKVVSISTYEDGMETDREVVKEEVVVEPVEKIVERGTITPPTYIKPVSGGRLSSGFGSRTAPMKGASSNHKGVDWAVPTGTPVYASNGGVVSKAGWGSGYGYVIYIDHDDGRQTRYAHLSKIQVSVGQTVKQGQQIALSGSTGNSTGPHVHFEILINGTQVNPLNYLS